MGPRRQTFGASVATSSWPTMMSLGGATQARKITARELPVWVDPAARKSVPLAIILVLRAERLLAEG
jgi:hypothetical protein